jgi:aldehyde dehydrogenase (NAD+)
VRSPSGALVGEVGEGNRKDIATPSRPLGPPRLVEGHRPHRAQILYYVAENLSARAGEFSRRIAAMTGASAGEAGREVEASIERLFSTAPGPTV